MANVCSIVFSFFGDLLMVLDGVGGEGWPLESPQRLGFGTPS